MITQISHDAFVSGMRAAFLVAAAAAVAGALIALITRRGQPGRRLPRRHLTGSSPRIC